MRSLAGRPYCLRAPSKAPRTLVVLLHGYGSSAAEMGGWFGLGEIADAHGLVLATPSGTPTRHGARFWNAFPSCCGSPDDAPLPDDVEYLSALIADARRAQPVERVWVIGHSNGGFMAHRLACARPDLVDAIASVAGTLEPARCTPSRAVTVIQVHGDADRLIHFGGGLVFGSTTAYASAERTVLHWAEAGRCDARPEKTGDRSVICDREGPGAETEVLRYGGCTGDHRVELWRMRGVGHVPRFEKPTWALALVEALSG